MYTHGYDQRKSLCQSLLRQLPCAVNLGTWDTDAPIIICHAGLSWSLSSYPILLSTSRNISPISLAELRIILQRKTCKPAAS